MTMHRGRTSVVYWDNHLGKRMAEWSERTGLKNTDHDVVFHAGMKGNLCEKKEPQAYRKMV